MKDDAKLLYGIKNYHFLKCKEDSRTYDVIKKIVSNINSLDKLTSPQEKLPHPWVKEFIESPHVLNLNVSITDEPGSILPWQVADLDIFN